MKSIVYSVRIGEFTRIPFASTTVGVVVVLPLLAIAMAGMGLTYPSVFMAGWSPLGLKKPPSDN